MKVKLINNSNNDDIYDVTIMLTNNHNKVMFLDTMFDRRANLNLHCDTTQFENDLLNMLKFVTDDKIQIE